MAIASDVAAAPSPHDESCFLACAPAGRVMNLAARIMGVSKTGQVQMGHESGSVQTKVHSTHAAHPSLASKCFH